MSVRWGVSHTVSNQRLFGLQNVTLDSARVIPPFPIEMYNSRWIYSNPPKNVQKLLKKLYYPSKVRGCSDLIFLKEVSYDHKAMETRFRHGIKNKGNCNFLSQFWLSRNCELTLETCTPAGVPRDPTQQRAARDNSWWESVCGWEETCVCRMRESKIIHGTPAK